MGPEAGKPLDYLTPRVQAEGVLRARRRRRKIAFCSLLGTGVVGFLTIAVVCGGLGQRRRVFDGPGRMEVIADGDRAWVSVHLERTVCEPGLAAGPPTRYPLYPTVLTFDDAGPVALDGRAADALRRHSVGRTASSPLAETNDLSGAVSFTWNGGWYVVEEVNAGASSSIRLRRADATKSWAATIVNYDARERNFRRGD